MPGLPRRGIHLYRALRVRTVRSGIWRVGCCRPDRPSISARFGEMSIRLITAEAVRGQDVGPAFAKCVSG